MGGWQLVMGAVATATLVAAAAAPAAATPVPFRTLANGRIIYTEYEGGGQNMVLRSMSASGTGDRVVTAESRPRHADISPDGMWMTHASDDGIVVRSLDGNYARVVHAATRLNHPTWKVDGRNIVYLGADGLSAGRVVVDTGADHRFVTACHVTTRVAFSPDGQRAAFFGLCDSGQWGMYLMDADGGNRSRVGGPDTFTEELATLNPTWSPDSRKILVQKATSVCNPGCIVATDLVVVDAESHAITNLTKTAGYYSWNEQDPVWSPDGKKIAFSNWKYTPGPGGDRTDWPSIWVMDADGSNRTRLTRSSPIGGPAVFHRFPAWAPARPSLGPTGADTPVLLVHGVANFKANLGKPWPLAGHNCQSDNYWKSLRSQFRVMGVKNVESVGYYAKPTNRCDVYLGGWGAPVDGIDPGSHRFLTTVDERSWRDDHYDVEADPEDAFPQDRLYAERYVHTVNTSVRHLAYHLAWYIYHNYTADGRAVNLVGHSMGGLIIRYMLTGVGREPGFPSALIVRNAVTVATPHEGGGFPAFACDATSEHWHQCEDLENDSEVQQFFDAFDDQGRAPRQGGIEWTLFHSESDCIADPERSIRFLAPYRAVYKRSSLAPHRCPSFETSGDHTDMLDVVQGVFPVRYFERQIGRYLNLEQFPNPAFAIVMAATKQGY